MIWLAVRRLRRHGTGSRVPATGLLIYAHRKAATLADPYGDLGKGPLAAFGRTWNRGFDWLERRYEWLLRATLTGTLTLNGPADASWLFKIGTTGTGALTGTDFKVVMSGGADPCNVTWWVAEAATMTTSNFIGTILAGAGITVTSGGVGTFNGRALGKAAVTITGGTLTGCTGGSLGGGGTAKAKCNQGVGNGPEGCDPWNSNNRNPSNDERGGTPGHPGRKGGH